MQLAHQCVSTAGQTTGITTEAEISSDLLFSPRKDKSPLPKGLSQNGHVAPRMTQEGEAVPAKGHWVNCAENRHFREPGQHGPGGHRQPTLDLLTPGQLSSFCKDHDSKLCVPVGLGLGLGLGRWGPTWPLSPETMTGPAYVQHSCAPSGV